MKKLIHSLLKSLGFKIVNTGIKEKQYQNFVKSFELENDPNNLVYSSAADIISIKKYFPELTLKCHKDGVLASFNSLKFYIETTEEFFILKEVFVEKDYNLLSNESYVVFDIGMNIGISSLFFGLQKNVEKIYSFEPVVNTYKQAIYNVALNENLSTKIEAFNIGLGATTRVERVLYNPQAKGNCGIRLESSLVIDKNNSKEIEINIQDVSTILPELFAKHTNYKKVLKIDCEGAEYEILQKLSDSSLLTQVDVLLIEWHDKGSEILENILLENNFRVVSRYLTSISGMIYAFKH
ncbi:FkbM family methyltransferase [Flavobacterium sp.]|uniref:FkbM family methyltransferase n=1 Tax=Flavobacterium sp. TaxID=239 RepID=UPI0038FC07D3